jgi:hypothetical protein
LEVLFGGQSDDVRKSIETLPDLLQSYLFFETWRNKGSVHGIHDDFGRHSYLKTKEIGDYYHIQDEERINLVLQMQELF